MATPTQILLLIRSLGFKHIAQIFRYSLLKSRMDRAYGRFKVSAPDKPGRLLEVHRSSEKFLVQFEKAELVIQFLASDLVRIEWKLGQPPLPYPIERTSWPCVEVAFNQAEHGYSLSSQDLKIFITLHGYISFFNRSGQLLREDLPPEIVETTANSVKPGQFRWKSIARLRPEECLFGLGEGAGALNLRGQQRDLWNNDPGGTYTVGHDPLYMPLPVYMGLNDHGCFLVFYQNSYPSRFSFSGSLLRQDEIPWAEAAFEAGPLLYYFLTGPPSQILQRFSELTGQPPLPPRWSLGYQQCRWGYRSEADIRQVIEGFEAHQLPISAIHLDIDYMDGYRSFTVNPHTFPDLLRLCTELNQKNIRLVCIVDPYVKQDPSYSVFVSGLSENAYCKLPDNRLLTSVAWPGECVYPDFTNPGARKWWGEQYRSLLDLGVSGFWHDKNEPLCFTSWGKQTLPLAVRHDLDGLGGDHRQAHNLYGLLMNRAAYKGLEVLRPDYRPWIVSRSGWVGNQRYAWNWTADIESTWRGLRVTLATILGMGLSGLPFTGCDIGGFSGNPSAELYIRWLQMATFFPFYRTHSSIGTKRREPWVFGEPYTSIVRKFINLRYHLMPYIYTQAWQSSQTGSPMVRPVFWAEPTDKALWTIEDEFMFGDCLLIAPVLNQNATKRCITIPDGSWFNFWNDEIYHRTSTNSVTAPLDQIPILVRDRSILPVTENDCLILHTYLNVENIASGDESYNLVGQLYSDDGDGYGDSRLDSFQIHTRDNSIDLRKTSQGKFKLPYNKIFIKLHGFSPHTVRIDSRSISHPDSAIEIDEFQHIKFEL